jgi:hypothetical protein
MRTPVPAGPDSVPSLVQHQRSLGEPHTDVSEALPGDGKWSQADGCGIHPWPVAHW